MQSRINKVAIDTMVDNLNGLSYICKFSNVNKYLKANFVKIMNFKTIFFTTLHK